GIEGRQQRRQPISDEQTPTLAVECHWEVRGSARGAPIRALFSGLEINHRNLERPRLIDKDALRAGIDLKTFRMGSEWDFPPFFARRAVQHCDTAVAITDQDLSGLIDTNVVGIAGELNFLQESEVRATPHLHEAVAAIGNEDCIGLRREPNS